MGLTIAIVGRPNVGKSALFNRLAGRRLAIVHGQAGITRDWNEADAQLGHVSFRLIDTAGFEHAEAGSLSQRMTAQTMDAIARADLCLFLVDARDGVTAGDEIIAAALRRAGKPVILAANKCESRAVRDTIHEASSLGFGEPIALSAEHGQGLAELLDAIAPYASEDEIEAEEPDKPLKIAIVGRPNTGKSSLFNRLLGEARALTGPEAGITRDAIAAPWAIGGRQVLLHDTAGLRKRARVAGHEIEELSVAGTLNAIRFAACVIVLIDAGAPFEKQDLAIADLVAHEGRAVVFAVNKWDLVPNKQSKRKTLREDLDRLLPQLAGAPLVTLSALTGEGIEKLSEAILEADKAWNTHVPTAQLNRFLAGALERHPPPAISGRRVRIRYMTQAKTRPPGFALFGNQLKALPQSYLRYLQKGLREDFGLKGTPIRFVLRTSKNPFAKA